MISAARARLWVVLATCAAIGFASPGVLAQEDGEEEIEAVAGEGVRAMSAREIRAQGNAEPPAGANAEALAAFYHRRGYANIQIGRPARAVEDLQLALRQRPGRGKAGAWGNRWRMQTDLIAALANHGNRLAAVALLLEMAAEYKETDQYYYLFSQLRLVDNYFRIGMWSEAEAARREADAVMVRLRGLPDWPTRGLSATRAHGMYLGNYFRARGDHAEGERTLREALVVAEKELDRVEQLRVPGDLSIRTARSAVALVKRNLAEALHTQGRHGVAEIVARSGLRDTLALYGADSVPVSHALVGIAGARLQQGDLVVAERYYRRALEAIVATEVLPHSVTLAGRRTNVANVLVLQGRWQEALAIYEERDEGLRSDPEQFKRYGSGSAGWAYALHKTGQPERAAKLAGGVASRHLKRPVLDQWYLAQLRGVQAMALAASGRVPAALKMFRQVIPDLVRRDLDHGSAESTGYVRAFWQRVILEEYLELLAKIHATGSYPKLAPNVIDETFRIAEQARGSLVQEAIASAAARARLPDRALADLARREQDALSRIVALNRVLGRLATTSESERLEKVIAQMREEIDRLRAERIELRETIEKRYPEYAELVDPRPAGPAEVRKALGAGEALISIYVGESQSYAWTLAEGGAATFRAVALRREEVEKEVRELRRSLDLAETGPGRLQPFDTARAHRLYRAFFEPDEDLWKSSRVLNVISHGALGQLPPGLLVTAEAQSSESDTPWLVRKVALAQLPSASAFAALRRAGAGKAGRQPFIGFGDPVFAAGEIGAAPGAVRNLVVRQALDPADVPPAAGAAAQAGAVTKSGADASTVPTLAQAFSLLSALPDTSDELKQIAVTLKADPTRDVFISRQATERNVKQAALHDRRVVAFATHGVAPGEITGLDQPALVLSNPALTGDVDNDGFLTMEEVLALKLDADWVVLSACNTASADGRGSEAVSGLGRAFFYAGARSLLVSNWAVETSSARLLTTELFRKQSENSKLTRAEALRQSMLDLMGRKSPAGFSYGHPAFWAPFSLVGVGGR